MNIQSNVKFLLVAPILWIYKLNHSWMLFNECYWIYRREIFAFLNFRSFKKSLQSCSFSLNSILTLITLRLKFRGICRFWEEDTFRCQVIRLDSIYFVHDDFLVWSVRLVYDVVWKLIEAYLLWVSNVYFIKDYRKIFDEFLLSIFYRRLPS